MAVTSASTDEQVEAEYEDTLSYALTADVALARRFVIAAGIRISRAASKLSRGGNSIELSTNLQIWQQAQRDAISYLRACGALMLPTSSTANQPRVYSVEGVKE